jgi:hypothetical protein
MSDKEQTELQWADMLKQAIEQPGVISEAYSAFHNYSLGNQMAAALQCAERGMRLGPLATFPAWKDKGRKVLKGERAIALCMPVTRKADKINPDTGGTETHTWQTFIWKNQWFTVWQTDGDDVTLGSVSPQWNADTALSSLGVTREPYTMADGNCQGYARERSVAVSPVAVLPHKTLFHEIAHVVLGHTAEGMMSDNERTPRDIREVEAESVAYLLTNLLGLKGSDESRGYIQAWLSGQKIGEKSAQKIYSAANKILCAGQSA